MGVALGLVVRRVGDHFGHFEVLLCPHIAGPFVSAESAKCTKGVISNQSLVNKPEHRCLDVSSLHYICSISVLAYQPLGGCGSLCPCPASQRGNPLAMQWAGRGSGCFLVLRSQLNGR